MIAPALILRDFDHVSKGYVNLGAVGSLRLEKRNIYCDTMPSGDIKPVFVEGEHTVAHVEFAAGGGCSVIWEGDVVAVWATLTAAWERLLSKAHEKTLIMQPLEG